MAFYPGRGTVLKMSTVNGAASAALSAAAQVVSISPPAMSNSEVDVTVLTSTWRDFINSVADGGSFSADLLYDPNDFTHARFMTLLIATTQENYRIVFPTTIFNIQYAALLTGFQAQQVVVADAWRASATFKVSGPVVVSTA